ncbi:discoidin domain-containing receptor tyrosine kinase B-like isoform X2 [Dermatophagoides pteronyssinus]|uniref:discoidin domain-containing receptor tyrosine kinase B-like isoform X2 n=1 Tax=Dermatophagoides pteronyssinus TaxID=6956 RepID=UPI003F665D26
MIHPFRFIRYQQQLLIIVIIIINMINGLPFNNNKNRLNKRQSSTTTITDEHEEDSNRIRIPSSLCNGQSYPLGMESGEIRDQQITSSSSYNLQSVGPQNARLNREIAGGAWCPSKQLSASYSGQEWIQVDLQEFYIITAIATQGRFGNGMGVEFAEEYWIEYSRDNGTTWNKWTDMNGDYKLIGNHDTYTPHKNIIPHPLVAISLIRIVPFASYQRTTCLRFELYGCRHDNHVPISYSIPDGYKDSSFGDLRDLTYDGRMDFYGYLHGGLGQLIDGIKGDDNYKVNYGYEWIGWKSENADLSMVFEFNTIVNLTSATFYCHNLFTKQIQVFAGAKVWFSYDGQIWSKRPIEFEYMPDLVLENPRDVDVHLHYKAARFVKFDFQFGSKWILMSEVTFNANPIDENTTLSYEQLDWSYDDDMMIPYQTAINNDDRTLFPQTTFFIVFGVLFAVICSVVIVLLRLHLRRKEKAGHIVVCMKDLATTPLYCEPKDFSSTSSTISNTIADPEYAVPDVAISNHHHHHPYHLQQQQQQNYHQMMSALSNGSNHLSYQQNNVKTVSNVGHLGNNLNMFGTGFTRILMGGHQQPAKDVNNVNKSTTPTSTSSSSAAANITANVVYSSQPKLQTNDNGSCYNLAKQIPATNVQHTANHPQTINSKTIAAAANSNANLIQRQFYVSADLIPKSPKLATAATKSTLIQSNSTIDPTNNGRMTCNTIYKRKMANDDMMMANNNSSSTLKLKYNSNSAMNNNSNEFFEESMKCIPEIGEQQINIIHKQLGCSQYGQIMLARMYNNNNESNHQLMTNNNVFGRNGYANDLSTETDTMNRETGNKNIDDKNNSNINDDDDGTLVLLKTLENDKLRSDFLHEMKSKWFISAKSERVAKLIGFLSSPSTNLTAMIVECGEYDLAHFLRNCDKKSIGIQSLLHIGSEVAAGMKYLESLGYVHRDLSAKNCLIYGDSLRVKITDFAALLNTNGHEYCNGVAIRWIAPEALINGAYTTKSDVYSFGITFWEILTYALIRPHHELDDDAFLQKLFTAYESYVSDINNDCSSSSVYYQATYASGNIIQNTVNDSSDNMDQQQSGTNQTKRNGTTRISYRLALPRPTTCPSEIYDLMLECWQLNEQIRPSFRDITQFLITRNNHISGIGSKQQQQQQCLTHQQQAASA